MESSVGTYSTRHKVCSERAMWWRVATKSYGPVVLVEFARRLRGKMSEYVADYGVGKSCSVWIIDIKRVDGWYLRFPAGADRGGRVQPETGQTVDTLGQKYSDLLRRPSSSTHRRCHRRRLVSPTDFHVLAEVVVFGQFAQRVEAELPTAHNERGVF